MIGRSIYNHPLRWSEIDQKIYGINKKPKSASNIIFSLIPYIENHLSTGGKSWDICKHLINLVEGIPKAKIWRNQISNKSSGAEGWEDRSYGNSSENSEYENGRSRRKRGVSNESNATNETN